MTTEENNKQQLVESISLERAIYYVNSMANILEIPRASEKLEDVQDAIYSKFLEEYSTWSQEELEYYDYTKLLGWNDKIKKAIESYSDTNTDILVETILTADEFQQYNNFQTSPVGQKKTALDEKINKFIGNVFSYLRKLSPNPKWQQNAE